MKFKILIACAIICGLIFILCSCSDKQGDVYHICENVSFTLVERTRDFSIYVHNETGVMYIGIVLQDNNFNNYLFGFSVMLDENGNPLIYKGEAGK